MNIKNKAKEVRKPRGRKPLNIHVTQTQKEVLQKIAKSAKASHAHAIRAQIILHASESKNNSQIAEEMGCNRGVVIKWRKRWSENQPSLEKAEANITEKSYRRLIEETALSDLKRIGRPNTFTAEQLCQIIAVAVQPPEKYGCPVTHWTPKELAQTVIKEGIVSSISPRHIGRFLKGMRSEATSVSVLAQ